MEGRERETGVAAITTNLPERANRPEKHTIDDTVTRGDG
jgi:hypothetical protein